MLQEDKELLLKDICARQPYGVVILDMPANHYGELLRIDIPSVTCFYDGEEDEECQTIYNIKPYLRPMSSMTEKEKQEMSNATSLAFEPCVNGFSGYCPETMAYSAVSIDYCLSHHLDFRGLIPMGLALEAPEGMYKTE